MSSKSEPVRGVDAIISEVLDKIVDFRHDLHAHPELGFEEHRTAGKIAEHLEGLGKLRVRTGIGETTGICAVLNADKSAPAVLLRAEMDALPMQEHNDDLPYKSRTPGKMHACGHDGHVACVVGAATVLAAIADELAGPVVFVFQPCEERDGGGGKIMVESGVLDDPQVGAAFALHSWPVFPVGKIGVMRGASMASTDTFRITVKVPGSHAAQPHLSADSIVVAAKIIDNIQQIASRMVNPVDPVVVTVGQIQGGTALNIIPDHVEMAGTIRTLSAPVRLQVRDLLPRICRDTAGVFGAEAEVKLAAGYPVLHNDPGTAEMVTNVLGEVLGPDAVEQIGPSMGAEDFSYYLQKVPGVMLRLGLASGGKAMPPLHSPRFNFCDAALPIGIKVLVELARRSLGDAHR